METQNEAAAPAAAESAATAADVESNMAVHPTSPPNPIPDPVPEPHVEAVEKVEIQEQPEQGELNETVQDPPADPVNVIQPTIGRKVWFRPAGQDIDGQPFDATIVYVHNDHLVNLSVVDWNGNQFAKTSVALVHEGEPRPEGGHFAEWMPFQKGQARAQQQTGSTSRFALVGDDVYYGDGTGPVWPAKITALKDIGIADLVVFERERVHQVFDVAKADLSDRELNGWVFKA